MPGNTTLTVTALVVAEVSGDDVNYRNNKYFDDFIKIKSQS